MAGNETNPLESPLSKTPQARFSRRASGEGVAESHRGPGGEGTAGRGSCMNKGIAA
jgi:hypothetical protein